MTAALEFEITIVAHVERRCLFDDTLATCERVFRKAKGVADVVRAKDSRAAKELRSLVEVALCSKVSFSLIKQRKRDRWKEECVVTSKFVMRASDDCGCGDYYSCRGSPCAPVW